MQFISAYLQLAGSRIGQKSTSNLQQEAAQRQTSIGMAENDSPQVAELFSSAI